MRYLLGFRPQCGCVTAAFAVPGSSKRDMNEFIGRMLESGRAVKPADDVSVGLTSCPHRGAEPTVGTTDA